MENYSGLQAPFDVLEMRQQGSRRNVIKIAVDEAGVECV